MSEPIILRIPVTGLVEGAVMECVALVDGAEFVELLRCLHGVRGCIACTPAARAYHESAPVVRSATPAAESER